jgi:ABC-2 type transport system ATP-binding protein
MGYDMINERRKIKQNIGYMSQRFSLYPDLTVKENLEFYARLYHVANLCERVDELIERYQLGEVSRKQAGALGTGIRQRVAFAAAQVHSPPLIILDEPTSGVDPLNRQRFWEELYQLAGQGVTILVTTHYMDEAERCDHIGLMNRGKLVASGEINQLKQAFAKRLQHTNPTLEEIFVYMIEQGGENERAELR